MDAYLYCKNKLIESRSSFSQSFRFLVPTQKRAMTVLYAFCREMDDIVDGTDEPSIARSKLLAWHDLIDNLEKNSLNPLCQAVLQLKQQFYIPNRYFHELITGMEMDLTQKTYLTRSALENYCYHAASTVGIMTCHILGFQHPDTLRFAKHFGMALQLINIIRDVGEDRERQRLYLPIEDLERFNIHPKQIFSHQAPTLIPHFTELMTYQAQQAKWHYHHALELLPLIDKPRQKISLIMGRIYLELLKKIERKSFDVFSKKIRLHPLHQLGIACYVYCRSL